MLRPSPDAPSGPGPVIQLSALGQTDLRVDGDVAVRVLSQPKRLGLLAYLCLARPRGIRQRQSLFPVFWPESSEANARLALNQSLAFLRRAMGPDAIVSHGRAAVEVSRRHVYCDVWALEEAVEGGRLADALQMYRGELLPGLHVSGSRQFERWLDGERDRVRTLVLGVAPQLVDELASHDRLGEAADWCTWARRIDPLSSDLASRLLSLLGRVGDERGLREAFGGYADTLDSALGIAPSPAVEEAFRAAIAQVEQVRREGSLARTAPVGVAEPAEGTPESGPPPDPVDAAVPVPGGATDARPYRRRRFRRPVVAALAAASVLFAAYLVRTGPGVADVSLEPRRALVAPLDMVGDGPEPARLARAAVDWAARELARTGMVQVVVPGMAGLPVRAADLEASGPGPRERAFEAGAGLVVSGSLYERDGGDLLEAAVVETATGRILARVGPVPLERAAPAEALATFSDRVAAAVAVAADPTLGEWAATVPEPPDFRAYRQFSDGLDALAEQRALDAADDFLAAADRDPSFITARIWAVRALVHAHRHQQADSIARSILHLRPDLTGWDRAMLDYYAGYLWGAWEDAYQAARELVQIAPDADWRHQLAGAARVTGRLREARAILEGLQGDERWVREWPTRWRSLGFTLHELGEFDEELALAEEWRARTPDASESTALGALAALGRFGEVDTRLDRILESAPADAGLRHIARVAFELRAHGHDEQAREVVARWLSLVDPHPKPGENVFGHARWLMDVLIAAGEYERAYETAADLGVDTVGGGPAVLTLLRGIAAAYLGKEEEARNIAHMLQDDDPHNMGHFTALSARILAALGDREGATERLSLAFSQGFGRYPWLHTVPEFLPLHDYEPFREIAWPER